MSQDQDRIEEPATATATATTTATAGFPPPAENSFHIGLTMAGAVSAGPYSAGVFDFLMEALYEWQKAKDRNTPGVPRHEVFISVISGASAGGITGALGLLSASAGIRPGEVETQLGAAAVAGAASAGAAPPASRARRALPELYDAWVVGPRLFARGSRDRKGKIKRLSALLNTEDLDKEKEPFVSALDSSVLTEIAETAFDRVAAIKAAPAPAVAEMPAPYRFLTDPVHLFLTLTNLDGVPYRIPFSGDSASGGHQMVSHADRVHYAIRGVGGTAFPDQECTWLKDWNDLGIDFDLSTPFAKGVETRETFIDAVLATSAFPVGLSPREIAVERSDYANRAWPIENTGANKIEPSWRAGAETKPYNFVAVDGGATDNQPFEFARWTIRERKGDTYAANEHPPTKADRAVIMIDPFGDPPPFDPRRVEGKRLKDLALSFVLRACVPALVNQARFKLTDLLQANDPSIFSRFLISPRRVDTQGIRHTPELASDLLYAFGGFIDQRFREHDYQLGRRNCQRFLLTSFVLHKDNALFGDELRHTRDDYYMQPDPVDKATKRDPGTKGEFRPVIPLVQAARYAIDLPEWPMLEEDKLDEIEKAIESRIDAAAAKLLEANMPSWGYRMVARFLFRRFARPDLVRTARLTVESALYKNLQIRWTHGLRRQDGTQLPVAGNRKEFAVMAALADPAFDFRTVKKIKEQYDVDNAYLADAGERSITEAEIEEILTRIRRRTVRAPRRWRAPPAYTLRHRQPQLRNPVVRFLTSARRWSRFDDTMEA